MSAHTETEPTAERGRFGIQKIITEIGGEIGTLLHNTLRLFARESQAKISFVITNLVKIIIAIGITLMGIGYLLAAANALLVSLVTPQIMSLNEARWVVPLAIGLLTALIGYILYKHGMRRVTNLDVMPVRTAESIEEDRDWILDKAKGNE